jgi:hypothetical protein
LFHYCFLLFDNNVAASLKLLGARLWHKSNTIKVFASAHALRPARI